MRLPFYSGPRIYGTNQEPWERNPRFQRRTYAHKYECTWALTISLTNERKLSYTEFRAKHKSRYAGFPEREIRKRYDSYLLSFEANKQQGKVAIKPSAKAESSGVGMHSMQFSDPEHLDSGELAKLGMLAPGVSLSKDSNMYVGALVDPEDPSFIGAAYPEGGQGPSMKRRGFVRTTMQIGTNGNGFVLASPLAGIDSSLGCVSASDSAWAGGKAFPNSASGVGQNISTSNSVVSGTVNNSDFARVVAACVKISPAGRIIDEAGIISTVNSTAGEDLLAVTEDQLQTTMWRNSQIHEQPREADTKFSALWSPSFPNKPVIRVTGGEPERVLANAASGICHIKDIDSFANYNLGILVTGGTPGFSYFVEFYFHYECFQGESAATDNIIRQSATPSVTDEIAVALVDSSTGTTLNAVQKTDDGVPTSNSTSEWLGVAAQGMTYFKNFAAGMSQQIGSNLVKQMGSTSQPALLQGSSLDDIGGFLQPSETVPLLEDSGPLIEEVIEGAEELPLLLM